jgi:hypothetical protein
MVNIRKIIALITVCLLLIPSFAVYADVIIEPSNDFYERHRSQIIYLGRSFTANGADGFASVKKEPGSKNDIAALQNGEVTFLQYTCLYDGDYWGYTFQHSGWININELLVIYDYVAFEEDYFKEFYLFDGGYDEIAETRSAVVWPWPGAGAPMWTFEDLDMENFRVRHAYTDGDGREWGFVAYMYGSRNIWVCLSDPLNRDIPAFNPAPAPMRWDSDTPHIEIEAYGNSASEDSILIVIIALIAALVVGTAVLIRVLWKPGGGGKEGNGDV